MNITNKLEFFKKTFILFLSLCLIISPTNTWATPQTESVFSPQAEKDFENLWLSFQQYKPLEHEKDKYSQCFSMEEGKFTWSQDFLKKVPAFTDTDAVIVFQKKVEGLFQNLYRQLKNCHYLSNVSSGSALFERFGALLIFYSLIQFYVDQVTQIYIQWYSELKQVSGASSEAPKLVHKQALDQAFRFSWQFGSALNKSYHRLESLIQRHLIINEVRTNSVAKTFTRKDKDRLILLLELFKNHMTRNYEQAEAYAPAREKQKELPFLSEEAFDTFYSKQNLLPESSQSVRSAKSSKKIKKIATIISNLTWGLVNTVIGVGAIIIMTPFQFVMDLNTPFKCIKKPYVELSENGLQLSVRICPLSATGASLGLINIGNSDFHEGGHSVQSALLGPLYLPAVLASYMIQGHSDSSLEIWAREWEKENDTFSAMREDD